MYDVTIKNNYVYALARAEVQGEPPLPPNQGYSPQMPGESRDFKGWGNASLDIWGMGRINFIDLGNRKLDAYTNPKIPWTQFSRGGLVRYRGMDAYFRYEGTGKITVTIDQVGSVSLHFDQGGMIINLNDLTVV
jgi:hypothetical protein